MRIWKPPVKSFIPCINNGTATLHAFLFIRHRYTSLALASTLYVAIITVFGDVFTMSGNFFVFLPVVAAALAFGTLGGLISGTLALPANLLLFTILGHPEYFPVRKLLVQISIMVIGLLLGRLADYFLEVRKEIKKRVETEDALRRALAAEELLLGELHHRVRNNLSVIKSLIQLQRNRSKDPAFLEAIDELIGRIFAIALAHDELDNDHDMPAVDPEHYLKALVGNLASFLGIDTSLMRLSMETGGRLISMEAGISLGLIVNEVLTNTLRHAFPGNEEMPPVRLSLKVEGNEFQLSISDDSPDPETLCGDDRSELSLKIVLALARNLSGVCSLCADEGQRVSLGHHFELSFHSQLPAPLSSR